MNRLLPMLFALPLCGCLGFASNGPGDDPAAGGDGGAAGPTDPAAGADGGDVAPPPPPVCTPGTFVGIGGANLAADRQDAAAATDRARMKSHASLAGEYARVTGAAAPTSLAAGAATFGAVPARWFTEPVASAMVLYVAHQVAFEACLPLTATDAAYAAAPTTTTAQTVCSDLSHRFWTRQPAPAELDACVQLATVDSSVETDVRRRWAYVCAAVLTSSGFLTF